MPLALETKVPGRHGRGLKPRKQNSPAWRHTGRACAMVSRLEQVCPSSPVCCQFSSVIIRSHTDGPHLYHR